MHGDTKELLKMKHRSTFKVFYIPPRANRDDAVAKEDRQLAVPEEAVLDTQYTADLLVLTCELAPAEVAILRKSTLS